MSLDTSDHAPTNRDHPLYRLYEKRVENNQDLITIVDDHHNRRGTGKTVLSLVLASMMDRTEAGVTTEKVTLTPEELVSAYTDHPPGSALILDEAEASVSKFRASSSTNTAIRNLVSMGRIEEKYVVFNLPAGSEMDRDLKALCDVWISVEKKGLATVHFLGWEPYNGHPLTPRKGTVRWSDLSQDHRLRDVYDYLTEEKRRHLRGEADTAEVVTGDDHRDAVEQEREAAEQDTRDDMIQRLYESTELTQQDIAETVDLSRSRVADILS